MSWPARLFWIIATLTWIVSAAVFAINAWRGWDPLIGHRLHAWFAAICVLGAIQSVLMMIDSTRDQRPPGRHSAARGDTPQ